jgi:maleate isomerase
VVRYGLVTPYLDEIQARILATFRDERFDCAAERHLGITDNFAFSEGAADKLVRMVREVAAAGPQAFTIFCTNLRGAPVAENLEQEINIYDTR